MSTRAQPRYLTKSIFKLALECPTKLFYAKKSNGYFDKNEDNDFLQALADGGHQVGELAKFKYHDNPVVDGITVETLDHENAFAQTQAKLSAPGRVLVAEAALLYAPYFVRVDILIQNQGEKTIDLIEVKSKSVKSDAITARFKNGQGRYDSDWLPYLYDVAFQTEVARMVFPGYRIRPKLLLVDSEQKCDVDGLHQMFQIVTTTVDGRMRVRVQSPVNLARADLGSLSFLREVDVDDIVNELSSMPIDNVEHVPATYREDLPTFMRWAAELQSQGTRYFHGVSKNCRNCQYRAAAGEIKRSGVHECWQDAIAQGILHGSGDLQNRGTPLSIDLWGGKSGSKSLADSVLKAGRAFLEDIQEQDVKPKAAYQGRGMSPLERRMAQIRAFAGQGEKVLLEDSRLNEMDSWQWPLHMIDFETSAPALPFFKGMKPYQTLAFQFSHHVMEKDTDGRVRIRHANQWISTAAGVFPSIEFVRQLRNALMPSGKLEGTVFRYHNHENSVLRNLRKTILEAGSECVPDSSQLIAFIDLITKPSGKEVMDQEENLGEKAMVDLHRLVEEGYYSQKAGGSISLKSILPAILHDAPRVAEMYSQASVYGKGLLVQSLNFSGHVWLNSATGGDPYKTLPGIFGPEHNQLNDMLQRLAGDADEGEGTINQGGLAMTAYNYTQFTSLSPSERQSIETALLRYCELDTLAMVMLVQGLMELRARPLILA